MIIVYTSFLYEGDNQRSSLFDEMYSFELE